MTLFWVVIFLASLAVLIKGADWLLGSAEKLGLALGVSPFVVGVIIVGLGTSFPELVSSFAAIVRGETAIVAANAVGSNIANILLVIGFSAIIAKKLTAQKDLIELDLPILGIVTAIFAFIAWDGSIVLQESILLLIGFAIYFAFTVKYEPEEVFEEARIEGEKRKNGINLSDLALVLVGIASLTLGAQYLIDSVIALSEIWQVGTGVIAISAVALGTSLPELIVSAKAALGGRSEVALGNIFGSNAFNLLVVVGLPGLFSTLEVDNATLLIGLPVLGIATFLFIISGISRKVYVWEGAFYILLYVLFVSKLFGLF